MDLKYTWQTIRDRPIRRGDLLVITTRSSTADQIALVISADQKLWPDDISISAHLTALVDDGCRVDWVCTSYRLLSA